MKKIIFYFVFFVILINSEIFSQSGWVKQPVSTFTNLIGMYFINNNTGWVCGDSSIILSTTNSGTNWSKTTYPGGGTLVSAYFKNQSTGIIGGYLTSHLNGFILKTTNGGVTWTSSVFSGEPYSIFSFGGDTVWASRHDGYVMKSTNMGTSWTSVFVHTDLELYTIVFTDNLTGWTGGAVYQKDAYIYKTTNGGNSWVVQNINIGNHFYDFNFFNNTTGYAVTLQGNLYYTNSGGSSWLITQNLIQGALFKVKFPNPNIGFTVGEHGKILKTLNGGTNWTQQLLPENISPNMTFYNAAFRDENLGWAIGQDGVILKTTNSGEPLGIVQINNSSPNGYKLSQNYPNPFNPSTTIEFDLPKSTYTRLIVYNLIGKEVEVLVDKDLSRGSYKVDFNNSNISSGVYYYKLTTNEFSDIKKFVLLK